MLSWHFQTTAKIRGFYLGFFWCAPGGTRFQRVQIDDVYAVEPDAWLFSVDFSAIIEFYYESAITFGLIKNGKDSIIDSANDTIINVRRLTAAMKEAGQRREG